jgi:LPS-assembly protein
LTPEFGLRHIAYSLRDTTDLTPSVSAPFASLDSGLFFEREADFGGRLFTQTLEPRLYYLYVPHRAQDHLPNFDTSLPDFTFANLFRNNRFVGGDRIGDANQLTMAVTTRLLDEQDGTERMRASIGRIHYFDERKVNVPAGTVNDASSDLAAEAVAWLPGNWHARATVHWTPELEQSARNTFYLQHQPAANKILNLGYRFIRNELEQSDISAAWPVGGRWSVRARSIYSLRDNKNVESYIGGEYNACCWVARVYLGQRLVQATGNIATSTEQRSQIHLELELAGFGKSPGGVDSPLKQGLFTFPAPPSKPAASPF